MNLRLNIKDNEDQSKSARESNLSKDFENGRANVKRYVDSYHPEQVTVVLKSKVEDILSNRSLTNATNHE